MLSANHHHVDYLIRGHALAVDKLTLLTGTLEHLERLGLFIDHEVNASAPPAEGP